jgi:flagellar protein FlaJ
MLPVVEEFRQIYRESGLATSFNDYMRQMAIIVTAVFSSTALLTFAVHLVLLRSSKALPASFILSLSASILAAFALLYRPLHRRNQNRAKIDNGLVYSLSYMTVLSASGISIERILARLTEVEADSPLHLITKKFLMDVELFGFDVTSALADVTRRSPSDNLRKLFMSINNTILTSGDLKGLLTYEVERQIQLKKEGLKKLTGNLMYMGEVYVIVMVVAPILFILMITILSVIGSSLGTSSVLQLNLIVFFGIPLMATGIIIVLDTMLGGDE